MLVEVFEHSLMITGFVFMLLLLVGLAGLLLGRY